MPKVFDRIKDAVMYDPNIPTPGDVLGKVVGAITPNQVERRVPQRFKNYVTRSYGNPLYQASPQGLSDLLAGDAELGLQLAQFLLPKTPGPVNLEGLGAEFARPSNLVPVSRASSLLKARTFGPPLYRELAKEGLFSGAFSGAETARRGGSLEDVAGTAVLGTGIGAVTPIGLEGAGTAIARIRGRQRTAPLVSTAPATESRKRKTRVSNMTQEERAEFTRPYSIEESRQAIAKEIAGARERLKTKAERLKNPLGERPSTGRGSKSKEVYASDLLTVDVDGTPTRYTLDLLRADAGEVEAKPIIRAGKHLVNKTRDGKEQHVLISIQEAEALSDLYDEKASPTITDIKKRLSETAKKDTAPEERTAAELELVTGDVLEVKGAPTTARATAIKQWIEKKAERSSRPLRRPDVARNPAVRARIRALHRLNDDIRVRETEQEELAIALAADKRRVEAANFTEDATRIARRQLEITKGKLYTEMLKLAVNSPRRKAILPRIEEIDVILEGKSPLPAELQAASEKAVKEPQTKPVLERIEKQQARWNELEAERAALLEERATHIGTKEVPPDPKEQANLIISQMGEVADAMPPPLPPSKAREVLTLYRDIEARTRNKITGQIADNTEYISRLEALDKFIADGGTGGRTPIGGNHQLASRAFRDYLQAKALREANPGGINKPQSATEPMLNFTKIALIRAMNAATGTDAWKDKGLRLVTMGRELAAILSDLTKHTGLNARAFFMEGNKKRYGSIMSVTRKGNQFGDWIVELRPEWKGSREAVAVPLKDLQLEYKDKDIGNRYDIERGIFEESRLNEMDETDLDPLGIGLTSTELRLGQGIKPLSIDNAEVRTTETLDANVAEAWETFQKTLNPIGPDIIDTAQGKAIYAGWTDVINSPLPSSKRRAAEVIAAIPRTAQQFRERMADLGVAISDPDLDQLVSDVGDPMKAYLYLRGKSLDPADLVRENALTHKMPHILRRALNFVTGQAFMSDAVRGINAQHDNHRVAMSSNVEVHYGGLIQAFRQQAIKDWSASGQARVTRRPKQLRFSEGDEELRSLQAQHFNPDVKAERPDLIKGIVSLKLLPDDVRAEVYDWMSRELRFLIDFPELFPGMPAAYRTLAGYGQAMTKDLHGIAALDNAREASISYMNRMMVAPEFRRQVDTAEFSKTPLEVIAAVAKSAKQQGKSIRDVFASGDELVKAEPMGIWNSALMSRVTEQVKALSDEKIKVGVDGDLFHLPGEWKIKSLDKWKVREEDGSVDWAGTKELQDSLRQLENQLNGLPDWKGLTKLSQAVASMVLTMDANIVAVQGYAAMSSQAVWSLAKAVSTPQKMTRAGLRDGAKAMGNYLGGVRQVMTDEGFHAWFRTRYDDIAYYNSLGLKTGMEAFIAGPRVTKLPLENVPFAGRLLKTGREFNDLQFNRWLLYLKVQAIDMQLDKAKTFRSIGHQVSKPFLSQPGIKEVADEMAGESAYLMGQPEEVVKAAIRTVNNKLGGISMGAQGIGTWRQTAEQILTIVPGFFRAQVGQLTTSTRVVTNPNTVEGWLALTGMAEEIAFAGAVGYGIALMTGNADKFNYQDMRRADWMAAPFDNSYIPIIPRTAVPRTLARLISESFDAAAGNGFDGTNTIKSFAQGRMSPLVNAAVGPTFFDEDFLGRRYRDKKDRVFAAVTSFMPIFIENIATDARENVAKDGWSAMTPLAYQTPLQFMGKSVVPRPPIDRLNEIAQQYSTMETPDAPGRNWNDLTKPEQDVLSKQPEVKSAVDNWDYYRQRRASPKEQQIEATFKMADQRATELRTGIVRFPDGKNLTMQQAYDLLLAGQMDGDEYREKLQYVNGRINESMEGMDRRLKELGFNLDDKHEDRITKLKDLFGDAGESKPIQVQLALWDSESITPEQYQNEVTVETTNGPVSFFETDWEAYQDAKDAALARYPDDVRLSAAAVADKWQDDGVDAYREAAQLRSAIEDMPRYRGLTNDQADKMDAMVKSFRDLRDQVRAQIGLPGSIAPLPEGLNRVMRAAAVKSMADQGFIRNEADLQLATLAIAMEENPQLREVLRGPEQLNALISNPDVIMFYPYLLTRIPVWLRGQLPQNLQPQFDIWNTYEGMI